MTFDLYAAPVNPVDPRTAAAVARFEGLPPKLTLIGQTPYPTRRGEVVQLAVFERTCRKPGCTNLVRSAASVQMLEKKPDRVGVLEAATCPACKAVPADPVSVLRTALRKAEKLKQRGTRGEAAKQAKRARLAAAGITDDVIRAAIRDALANGPLPSAEVLAVGDKLGCNILFQLKAMKDEGEVIYHVEEGKVTTVELLDKSAKAAVE